MHAPAGPAQRVVDLQAAAGNAAVARLLRDRGGGATATPDAGADAGTAAPAGPNVDEIEKRYRAMVKKARDDGYEVAADNLERWLAGTGGVKKLDVTWLRDFNAITSAERVNQERFEKSLTKKAKELKDGETATFNDHWHRKLTANMATELYYASGTSTIKSTGTFTLSRKGNEITITGTVDHHWYDPYDWHAGLGAYVPGFGVISDADALVLERERGAAQFDMEADWQQTVTGTVSIGRIWDSESYEWSGP